MGQPSPTLVTVKTTTCQPGSAKSCSATVNVTLDHPGRLFVQSATSGLQEAVEAAHISGGGIVEIAACWRGSSREIAIVELPSDVFLLDLRGPPPAQLYGASLSGAPQLLPSQFGAPGTGHPTTPRVDASNFPGSDLGQRISAAAAALGASGEIVVSKAGEIRSPVSLCPSCTLQINAPVTLAAPILLADGDTVRGNLGKAPLLAEVPADGAPRAPTPLIIGNGVSNITVEDVMAIAANGPESDTLLACLGCARVTVTGNIVLNAGVAFIGSTAPGVDQTTNPQYPNVNASDESTNVVISNNIGYGAAAMVTNGIEVDFSSHIDISGNTLQRYSSGIQWWGGDACAGNCIGVWVGDGAPANPRKISDLTISKNGIYDVARGCIWGSMGTNVVVDGNVADGSGDVGVDTEGGDDIVFSNNNITGAANFQLAAFWLEQNVQFINNTLYSSHAGWAPIIEVRNPFQTAYDNGPLEIIGNTISCGDPVQACSMGTTGGAVNTTEIQGNVLTDTTIDATSNNLNRVVIHGNQISFDRQFDVAFDAIQTAGTSEMPTPTGILPAYVEISDNTVRFAAAEPAGTVGISVTQGDYNSTSLTDIADNVIDGTVGVDIETVRDGGNPGIVPVFQISSNTVQTGTFRSVNENGSSQVELYDNHLSNRDVWPPPL
ncbi:MAG: right-handed parallel beta-helix repeat-containing protein [Terriglobales bacterium]